MKFKHRIRAFFGVAFVLLAVVMFQFHVSPIIRIQASLTPVSDHKVQATKPNQPDGASNSDGLKSKDGTAVKGKTALQHTPIILDGKTASKHQLHASNSSPLTYVRRPRSWECPRLLRPENVRETFQFQQVDGQNRTFVYSAFFDERDAVVRVISITLAKNDAKYRCHLWYNVTDDVGGATSQDLSVSPAAIQIIPEHHNRKYTAAYINCSLPDPNLRPNPPYAISVTSLDCHHDVTPPTNVLPVQVAFPSGGGAVSWTPKHNFTVCVKPLNRHYSRAHEVVEFIELNRMLGATRFQLYLHTAGPNVKEILNWYQEQGVVEMLDWRVPVDVDHWPPVPRAPKVHAFGQLATSNDCLFRNRGSSRYLVMVDWDELLVPRNHSSWMELIQHMDDLNGQQAAVYLFRCLFFRKDFLISRDDFPGRFLAERFHANSLLVDQRNRKAIPIPVRSKYIMDPRLVHMAGIHFVHRLRKDKPQDVLKRTILTLEQGSSYHYRDWNESDHFGKVGVKDTDMRRFKEELLKRLESVWSHFPGVPLDIPLSYYKPV